ncbi:MAG: hypothetical protein HY682_02790 [Chloroflexi bacterium]|nr:hypothetical protein [Chloroflexota bacterium]
MTCTYRLVKEQTGNFGYREYLFSVDASGTASGPVDTNLSVTLKGLPNNTYTTTLTGDWTRTGSISRRRGSSDPYSAAWTVHGEYDKLFNTDPRLGSVEETEKVTLKVFAGTKTAEKAFTCK